MSVDTCVCCGEMIPEGRQVCWNCENSIGDTKKPTKAPSDAQIDFADKIAETLGIDFPQCSEEFTAEIYWQFINSHIDEFKSIMGDTGYDDDDWYGMAWFSPLNQ